MGHHGTGYYPFFFDGKVGSRGVACLCTYRRRKPVSGNFVQRSAHGGDCGELITSRASKCIWTVRQERYSRTSRKPFQQSSDGLCQVFEYSLPKEAKLRLGYSRYIKEKLKF